MGIRIEPDQFRVVGNTRLNIGGDSVTTVQAGSSAAIGLRMVGRSADNVAILDFLNNAQDTQYAAIRGDAAGMSFNTGSSTRAYTFNSGRINSNAAQPSVIAYLSSDQTGVIGGTDINFDTEVVDQAGNFASSTFTAPATGAYMLCGCVTVKNLSGTDATLGALIDIAAIVNGSVFYSLAGIPTPFANTKWVKLPISAFLHLTVADTVKIRLTSGGGQSLTVEGNASSRQTWLGIRLLV